MKSENPISLIFPGFHRTCLAWFLSIRHQTLIASISPVIIGSLIASMVQPLSWKIFVFTLLFSLSLQIGTNWANDYFDFINGADTNNRKGPHRAVQLQQIPPKTMRNAAFAILFLAAIVSLPLIMRIGMMFFPLILLCIPLAIFYTGGKRPLGYLGFGDLLVLIFFGPIATCGTILAQLLFIPSESWIASLIPGCMSCAILCVNNLRDVDEDRKAKKLTLVARFGTKFGKMEYGLCLMTAALVPLLLVCHGWPTKFFILWLALPLAQEPLQIIFRHSNDLNRALSLTAKMLAVYTILFCVAVYAHLYL